MLSFNEKEFISTKEASELSGYGSDYIARLAKTRKLESTRIGKSWFIRRDSLKAFINGQHKRKEEISKKLSQARADQYRKARSLLGNAKKAFVPVVDKLNQNQPLVVDGVRFAIQHVLMPVIVAALVVGGGYASARVGVVDALVSSAAEITQTLADGTRMIIADAVAGAAKRLGDARQARMSVISPMHERTAAIARGGARATVLSLPDDAFAFLTESAGDATTRPRRAMSDASPEARVARDPDIAAAILAERVVDALIHPQDTARQAAQGLLALYLDVGARAYASMGDLLQAYERALRASGGTALALGTYVRAAAANAPATIAGAEIRAGESLAALSSRILRTYGGTIYAWNDEVPQVAAATAGILYETGTTVSGIAVALVPTIASSYDNAMYAWADGSTGLMEGVLAAQEAFGTDLIEITRSIGNAELAFVRNAGASIAVLPSMVASVPTVPEAFGIARSAVLGALGGAAEHGETTFAILGSAAHSALVALNTAGDRILAAAATVLPAPALSGAERAALFTYEADQGLFDGAGDTLSFLFGPRPLLVGSPDTPSRAATVTSSIVISGPTTVVRNVTQQTVLQGAPTGYVDLAIADMRNLILAEVNNLMRYTERQFVVTSNTMASVARIEHLGNLDLDNPVIDGGTIDNAQIRSSTFEGTSVDTDSLSVSGNATVTGNLTISGTFSPAVVAATSAVTSPYFTSTSTTANTFPYASSTVITALDYLAVGRIATSTIYGDSATSTISGRFAVGTTSPWGDGLFVVGTTSPLLVIHGTSGKIGIGTPSPSVALSIDATDAIKIPVGTTGERPGAVQAGQIRYNTSLAQFEGYSSGSWGALGGSSDIFELTDSTTIEATTTNAGIGLKLDYFTATSTSASTFPYASSTALTVSGTASTTNLIASAAVTFQNLAGIHSSNGTSGISARTLTGTTNQITVTNGDGTGGNPTFSLPSQLAFTNASTSMLSVFQNAWFGGTATSTFNSQGWLGIGTSSPGTAFAVEGASLLGNVATAGYFTATSTLSSTFPYASSTALTASGQANIGSLAGAIVSSLTLNYLPKWNSGTFANSLVYDDGTNVGVATTSPWAKFSVGTHNLAVTSPAFVIASSSVGLATSTQFVVVNGNVGVGTVSPGANLHILSSGTTYPTLDSGTVALLQRSGTTGAGAVLQLVTGNAGLGIINFGDTDDINVGRIRYNHNGNSLEFYTNDAEVARANFHYGCIE